MCVHAIHFSLLSTMSSVLGHSHLEANMSLDRNPLRHCKLYEIVHMMGYI